MPNLQFSSMQNAGKSHTVKTDLRHGIVGRVLEKDEREREREGEREGKR